VRPALRRAPDVPLWLAVVVAIASAWATERIGIHAIFGAFMAGTIMPRSLQLRERLDAQVRPLTDNLLLPMFFAVVGLATRIDLLDDLYLWGLTALVVATAIVGKFGGASLAARATGESWRDSAVIGVLMNTRGLTEIVILTVGLELGVIGDTMFTIMVLMALITTFMATPILALLRPEQEPEADELDEDAFELAPPPGSPPTEG
jgi:Kef-type K+ transport system membrane component KefB